MSVIRREARVRGTVQGVGFRPFVYRLALSLGLSGLVRNTSSGVVVEVEGEEGAVLAFLEQMAASAPPLSHISSIETRDLAAAGREGFHIEESAPGSRPTALIPPDVALCEECGQEIADRQDRRFAYPFTNCTNCGPRFTIVLGIPYDRAETTMARFAMCADCAAEYRDPGNRRFHAEPIACPVCGPSLFLDGRPAADAVARAATWLAQGRIVAVKGLGGYHLACDARNAGAVEELRSRKGRGQKPFAIMVRDLPEARRVACLEDQAEQLLTSLESPVVILPARPDAGLAPGIAPRQSTVGVMLPYTPLHRLLLDRSPPALVMTSGNLAEEPIEHRDEEARLKLGPVADHFLSHNREIAVPCDDSVVRCAGGLVIPVRRARGLVPRAIPVGIEGPPVLAVGGYHKNTFCLLRGGEAILSQHIGDLDTAEVLDYFGRAVDHFGQLLQVRPEVVACDLHPGYLSTQYAQLLEGVRVIPVQHHHAHVASVMAELGISGRVIGVSYDGTGYGPDGTAWGGEILVADYRSFERAYHLLPVRLAGGEAAVRHPQRMALSHLRAAFSAGEAERIALRAMPDLSAVEVQVVMRQVERGLNSPLTSSMGRFFDAAGALLGATPRATYEGQPAMELESMAASIAEAVPPYSYVVEGGLLDPRPGVRALAAELDQGVDRGLVAARFHETVAAFTIEACRRVHAEGGPGDVVLSGGVMQNARLVSRLIAGLGEAGLRPHVHREVPPNDGGLSLGQAVIAAARSES